jgi:hypothetical protein
VIVYDFNILCTRCSPAKANAILVIDPNAVLPKPIAFERFQAIARRYAQVFEHPSDLQLSKLASSDRLNVHEARDSSPISNISGVRALERHDHAMMITWGVINVNREY